MKKILLSLLSAAFMLFSAMPASALNLPVKEVNGKLVYYYTVVKGDKLYNLAEKIGVTKGQMVDYNPQIADGLIPGTVLTFPVTLDATVKDGYYLTNYKVNNNESIYGVSSLFKVPVDKIIEFNPAAKTGVKGMTLIIPLCKAPVTAQKETAVKTEKKQDQAPIPAGCFPYIVKLGDTLDRIAEAHEVTPDVVKQINPDTDFINLKVGEMIYLPQIQSLEPSEKRIGAVEVVEPAPVPVVEPASEDVVLSDDKQPVVETVEEEVVDENVVFEVDTLVTTPPLSIAVMLPFMLNEEEESRTSQLYTEFYRGFLMGVEEMSHSGTPVKISAFDTCNSPDSIAAILASPQLQNINVFIAPDNQQQLALIAEKTNENENSYLLNIFAVKDNNYLTNSSIIQANIPHPAMYRKAIESFVEMYEDRIPVFISRVGGSGEKIEFTDSLKSKLNALGREYKEINFKNFLGRDNLEGLNPDSLSYVFVPGSGSRQEFNKFAPAIKNLRTSAVDHDNVVLYGYPEYIMFRGDNLDMLHSLNTTIYSRYLSLPDLPEVKAAAANYKAHYGVEMEEAVPMQALIGYDTAKFLINSLRNNEGAFADSSMDYDGVQMGFSLEETPEGGLVNENLYLIEYRPGGVIAKHRL